MEHTFFTVEEENLICIFNTGNRTALIQSITDAIPDFDEPRMDEIAESAIKKLNEMTDAEFAALELYPEYGDNDEQEE